MVQLEDTKEVMRAYFAIHLAIRKDLLIIEEFCGMPKDEQEQKRAGFLKWFAHHRDMMASHNDAEHGYYFPILQKHLNDGGDFATHLLEQTDQANALGDEVVRGDSRLAMTELVKRLRTYCTAVRKRIDDEEIIYVPLVMQNYTREQYAEVEREYRKKVKLSFLPTFISWMSTKASPKQRQSEMPILPKPFIFLLDHFWEPAYKKRFPDWIVGTPRELPYDNIPVVLERPDTPKKSKK